MKKFNLAIFFISLFFTLTANNLYSQNGWFSQYSTNLDHNAKSIFFLNAQTGWVIQDSNFVYKTVNGGLTWITYQLSYKSVLESIHFLNENTGWACGNLITPIPLLNTGVLYKTTNGGMNWTHTLTGGLSYTDVSFINEHTGFAAVSSPGPFVSGGWVSITTNSGTEWGPAFNQYRNFGFREIKFVNHSTGYALGRYLDDTSTDSILILKTQNLGQSWDKVLQIPRTGSFVPTITFIALENKIWLVAYNKLFYSTNYGLNWQDIPLNNIGFGIKIFFANQNTGWITKFASASDSLNLLKTTNGGLNWTGYRNPLGNMQDIFFVNEYTGWVTTTTNSGGVNILKSVTGGIMDVGIITQPFVTSYQLHQNYPNPFNPVTRIRFEVSNYRQTSHIQLYIYDISGKLVSKLINNDFEGGIYEINWNAGNLPSGTYLYSLISGDFKQVKKMILMK